MIPSFISTTKKQLVLFDMDGVCAEYVAGQGAQIESEVPGVYANERPVFSVIKIAGILNNMQNVSVGILSTCHFDSQVKEKLDWLKKYMPFVPKDNIYIITYPVSDKSKDTRGDLKADTMAKIKGFDEVYLIEDSHKNIKSVNKRFPGMAHHVSILID